MISTQSPSILDRKGPILIKELITLINNTEIFNDLDKRINKSFTAQILELEETSKIIQETIDQIIIEHPELATKLNSKLSNQEILFQSRQK